jgi:hypothetical protein
MLEEYSKTIYFKFTLVFFFIFIPLFLLFSFGLVGYAFVWLILSICIALPFSIWLCDKYKIL